MKNVKRLILTCLMGMATVVFSQTPEGITDFGTATVSSEFCLSLGTDEDIQEYYLADATALGWDTLENAYKMCGFHSDNLVTLSPDFENGKVIIHIHNDRPREPKDVSWWNQYLSNKCN